MNADIFKISLQICQFFLLLSEKSFENLQIKINET